MLEKTREYRKELANIFIHALEEKQLDWKKEWGGKNTAPVNVKSGARYKGINRFRLMLVSMERQYKDPRWATFHQVEEMGYRLKNAKGQGIKVEYWFPYDRKEKHAISWDDFYKHTEGCPNERYILSAKYSTVFNGSLIEGLPELLAEEKRDIEVDKLVTTLSRNMQVEIIHNENDRAFYRPSEDKIYLPKPELFHSDYSYNSTALHELAHATGASNRLNRNISGHFGTPEYAYEELIAEISSCFMSENLQTKQDEQHIENHKAYVQSWIQEINEKPETLVRAIAEAEKAAAYMEYHAELIPQKEYEQVVKSSVEVGKPQPVSKKAMVARGPRL